MRNANRAGSAPSFMLLLLLLLRLTAAGCGFRGTATDDTPEITDRVGDADADVDADGDAGADAHADADSSCDDRQTIHLTLSTQPSTTALNDVPFVQQPVVHLLDSCGAEVARSGVTIRASLVAGTPVVANPTAVTDSEGVATFRGLKLTGTVGVYHLQFADSDGAVVQALADTSLVPGAADAATSTVMLEAATAVVGGDTTTVTLVAYDASGNPLSSGGSTVTFDHAGGTSDITLGPVTDRGDGTYTAEITANAPGTATTLTATINGELITTPMPRFAVIPTSSSSPVFEDNFDSGARTSAQNGYQWTSSSSVSVSNELAYSGTHSLRFPYGPDLPGEDSWAEQRFRFGEYLQEVWIEFMWHVPANYFHRHDDGSNNKIFVIWRDDYNHPEAFMALECQPNRRRQDGQWIYDGSGTYPRPMALDSNGIGRDLQNLQISVADFISATGAVKPGTWTQMRIHLRTSSSGATDGIYEVWTNGTLLVQKTDGDFHGTATPATARALHNGYLMGWSNSGFSEQTVFHIDDVKIYNADPGW